MHISFVVLFKVDFGLNARYNVSQVQMIGFC